MKRVILLIMLLIFTSGCSTYSAANYRVNFAGEVEATGHSGETLSESDLIGKDCKVHFDNGLMKKGRIRSISLLELFFEPPYAANTKEENSGEYFSVAKTDICELEIRWVEGGKTFGLFVALGVAGYLGYLVLVHSAMGSMH